MTAIMDKRLKKIRRNLAVALAEAKKLHEMEGTAVFVVLNINKAICAFESFAACVDACPRCGSREEICPC